MNAKKNVAALAVCQGLLVTNNIAIISIGSLAGYMLATNKALSTLPATAYIAGGALSTYPISLFMKRHGRRAGFTLGAGAGLLGALICTLAVAAGSFGLFCLGTFIAGSYTASGGYYRFAAADAASMGFKSRAISLVLAGGIIGGVLGPESSKFTKDLLPVTFMGSYAAVMVFALIAIAILRLVDLPMPTEQERSGATRPLAAIVRQPVFVVACLGAVSAYAVMNLLMGVTPLAMQMCGLPYASAALVIEWHIIGMFAPALVAGSLVHRFGALRVMGAGLLTYLACMLAAVTGQNVLHFWMSGTLLGLGWCLLYVGATTLLTDAYAPAEKAKAQGINDTLVFAVMGTSNALSGAILYRYGWNALNYSALPLLLATAIAVVWLALARRAVHANAAPVPTILE
ncbi:MAG TPA: MFS transporter [Burkholderiales bacterium]|nr:MFS transporter [Burkholderiales bacterium]